MAKVLTKSFFERDTLIVAKELLGKFLVVGNNFFMITEVEAYDGHEDKASHASKGKTDRTAVMFGEAGNWYVYLIYGMYYMLNIVTGPKDYPAAILIRGVEGFDGPGKLTKALGITKKWNGLPARKNAQAFGGYIEDRGVKIPKNKIKKSARIGVNYAGPVWSKKEYRFCLADDVVF